MQGVHLAVAQSPVAIGNTGGLLEDISMVAYRASGNKFDNIMVVREFIIFCVIKHHSGSPITIGNKYCILLLKYCIVYNYYLVTLGCLAASSSQPGHHGVSAISSNLHDPGCY